MKTIKTLKIKLNPTEFQEQELKSLFDNFNLAINWSIQQIEQRHNEFFNTFIEVDEPIESICSHCGETKKIKFIHVDNSLWCSTCANRMYSEYTVRKETYSTGGRVVENDIKDVCYFENKTHYGRAFAQAYAIWKSFNGWRNKRIYEANRMELEFVKLDQRYLKAAMLIEQKSADNKRDQPKLMWKNAKAIATKEVFADYSDSERKTIKSYHDKIINLRKLKREMVLPQLDDLRTVFLQNTFVNFDGDDLYITLQSKGKQHVNYFGHAYLEQYIPLMQNNKTYCNINRKDDTYYLMFPLSVDNEPTASIEDSDMFVFVTTPYKIGVVRYDEDGLFISIKWFSTGKLLFAKQHYKDKRKEISERKYESEPMRKIRRRKQKIKKMGNVEQRFVSTFNHQLMYSIIKYIKGQSDTAKIVIWDVGNGIRMNFGTKLNVAKNMWPAVQQQDYLAHKAALHGIHIVKLKYNSCNDLKCSLCGAVHNTDGKTDKVITQLIKRNKTFKCDACGYKVNQIINHANRLSTES